MADDDGATHVSSDTPSDLHEVEAFEEAMYDKKQNRWFMAWILCVMVCLYAVIIALSTQLDEGVPI